MRIYHYTNIETLALILKNRTIRFNRLDHVDDLEEGRVETWSVYFCFMLDRGLGRKYTIMAYVYRKRNWCEN